VRFVRVSNDSVLNPGNKNFERKGTRKKATTLAKIIRPKKKEKILMGKPVLNYTDSLFRIASQNRFDLLSF